jgi:hypothetical protein
MSTARAPSFSRQKPLPFKNSRDRKSTRHEETKATKRWTEVYVPDSFTYEKTDKWQIGHNSCKKTLNRIVFQLSGDLKVDAYEFNFQNYFQDLQYTNTEFSFVPLTLYLVFNS